MTVSEERDLLRSALSRLVAQHERPHGFDDSHWYREALDQAKCALSAVRDLGFIEQALAH
jgi:hypothetical protein